MERRKNRDIDRTSGPAVDGAARDAGVSLKIN